MNLYQKKIQLFNIFKWFLGVNNSKRLLFYLNRSNVIQQKIIFIHIPKAAGTSIANAIYNKRIGHFTFKEYEKYLGKSFNSFPLFTVVRNPYERLFSAYCFAKKGGTRDGGVNNPSLYKHSDFNDFNYFVNNWLVNKSIKEVDLIFRPQIYFLDKDYINSKIKIFYLQDINNLNIFLSKTLNRKVLINEMNKNKSKDKVSVYDIMSNETIQNINKYYDEDFKHLNFNKL